MVTIRFPDVESKRRALGFLADRFAFTHWTTGEVVVPDDAVPALTGEKIPFDIGDQCEDGPTREEAIAAYERGETLDIADAFAQIAGMDRESWLKHVEEHRQRNHKNGTS